MLFKHLIYLWSWGFLSLPFCQRIAMHACADITSAGGHPQTDLDFLAHIGTDGLYAGNMKDELMRRLKPPDIDPPLQCRLPYKTKPGVVEEQDANVLLPHALFSNIYHSYPAIFNTRIMQSQAALEEFWDQMDGHPLLDHMQLKNREDGYRSNAIPLRIHGDDTPVTGIGKSWTKVCLFFSWTKSYFISLESRLL